MQRRSRAGSKSIRRRRRSTATLKRSNAPKVGGRRKPSSTNANTKNALLERERDELLEQQKATAEVLRVISSSPGDLKPVFAAILESATRLCDANFATLWLAEGDALRAVALHNAPPSFAEARRELLVQPAPKTVLGRVTRTKRVVHVTDLAKEDMYIERNPLTVTAVEIMGVRTMLGVPMLRDNELIGTIVIYRQEVRPFTDPQIELVRSFAAQAVIAIENTRLLSELRQRTDDLTESLEQQTATSEVLKVISSSPGELQSVFRAVLENAVRICEANFGTLYLVHGGSFHFGADVGTPPEYAEFQRRRGPYRPTPGTHFDRILQTKRVSQSADAAAEAVTGPVVTVGGARSFVAVPMLKDDVLVGAIGIYRQEVRPFTDKQSALVENFAAQAVIAIENTRLLNELRQSLEQQTATSEVLGVISSSPGTLEPVFKAMLENATRLCEANFGILHLHEGGGTFSITAAHNAPPAFAELQRREPLFQPSPQSAIGRAIATKWMVHIADYAEEPVYKQRDPIAVRLVELAGARSLLTIPMLKEDELIGTISIFRQEVRPFTEKQIVLVTNFAAQAVIAIENTRLLNELRESLQQQTATADVLKVISSSPGELEPVFQAMLENATRICEAKFGILFRLDDGVVHVGATLGVPLALAKFMQSVRRPGPHTATARAMRTGQVIHILDVREERGYREGDPMLVFGADKVGLRTLVAAPMLKDKVSIGSIGIYRTEVRPFTDKQIELLRNFAAQAVIAIENTRLLSELRQSLEQQTATAEVLSVISSSPGELEPVFQAMLENATRVCDAKFGTLIRFDGEHCHVAAQVGTPPEYAEFNRQRGPYKPTPGGLLDSVIRSKRETHTADATADVVPAASARLGGARTRLVVPMLKEDMLIGAISIYRQEVRPFTDKQIDLVKNFAAQAVIAIENTRLLNELRQSLEKQTATADVLRVISSSPGDLEPVFQAMLENATRICEAKFGTLFRFDGKEFQLAAEVGTPPEYAEFQQQRGPFVPPLGTRLDLVMRTKEMSQSGHLLRTATECRN